jgi:hypothetical protein
MTQQPPPSKAEARARFRRTLIRVLIVQAVALAALAALQLRYGV